jgi:hypothetical protein
MTKKSRPPRTYAQALSEWNHRLNLKRQSNLARIARVAAASGLLEPHATGAGPRDESVEFPALRAQRPAYVASGSCDQVGLRDPSSAQRAGRVLDQATAASDSPAR